MYINSFATSALASKQHLFLVKFKTAITEKYFNIFTYQNKPRGLYYNLQQVANILEANNYKS